MSAVAPAEATAPPERRGVARDLVRLLVGRGDGTLEHRRIRDLPRLLAPGDLLVVNTSATLPAALDAVAPGGRPLRLHLSTPLPGADPDEQLWTVELRIPAGPGTLPFAAARRGWRLALPGGGRARLLRGGPRLWTARLDLPGRPARAPRGPRPPDPLRLRRRATGRSPTTRPCLRRSRAAPRCRAPGARSRPSS